MKYFSLFFFFFLFSTILHSQDKITLLFAGDLMQHKGQIDAAKVGNRYDYSDCFKHVKEEISKADIAVGNLEVTLGGKPYMGYPMFSAPDEYLYAIKDAGFDVLLTANNHCLDRGKNGLQRTIRMLDSLDIAHLGTYATQEERDRGYPLFIKKDGFHIAFLNYTYGTNGVVVRAPNVVNYIDKNQMQADIKKARSARPDVIIACIHWGQEYKPLPDADQKELADWLLDQGVTHVIGAHPHVLQPMELRQRPYTLDKNVVVYSLGNFISNMSTRQTEGGAMFKLELTKRNSIVRVTGSHYCLVWTSRPALSGKKKFVLYPASGFWTDLTPAEANHLKIFMNDARSLFDKHNIGIDEYIF